MSAIPNAKAMAKSKHKHSVHNKSGSGRKYKGSATATSTTKTTPVGTQEEGVQGSNAWRYEDEEMLKREEDGQDGDAAETVRRHVAALEESGSEEDQDGVDNVEDAQEREILEAIEAEGKLPPSQWTTQTLENWLDRNLLGAE